MSEVKNKDTISVAITKAEVTGVTLYQEYLDVYVELYVGEKVLTSVILSSTNNEKSAKYVTFSEHAQSLRDELFREAQRHANISLERIQNQLGKATSFEEEEVG